VIKNKQDAYPMPLLLKLRYLMAQFFSSLRWYSLLLFGLLYTTSVWLGLAVAGEDRLTAWPDFIYWLAVTTSTIGYGDFSPATNAGKLWVSFYVIPVGLSLFALTIGRLAAWTSQQWFKGVKGLKDLDLKNHIIVIGWHGNRTLNLLKLLLAENADTSSPKTILLCVTADMENPLPGQIDFIKAVAYTNDGDMYRACLSAAAVIIIDTPSDDITMTTALYCQQQSQSASLIAYFSDEALANLLKQHCPNIECTPSVSVEMLVKAAFDPGSSALHQELLNTTYGQSQYSVEYPAGRPTLPLRTMFLCFKEKYQATLIGVAPERKAKIQLNPPLDMAVHAGSVLYYVADQRLQQIDWEQFHV
jgi:voltage-gated potassium channel